MNTAAAQHACTGQGSAAILLRAGAAHPLHLRSMALAIKRLHFISWGSSATCANHRRIAGVHSLHLQLLALM